MTKVISVRSDPCDNGAMDETRTVEQITADSLVYEIVQRHPRTITVLARHGLHCAGCYISPFHSIADSARAYAIPIEPLLHDLNRAVFA